jgi:hypothetical protein
MAIRAKNYYGKSKDEKGNNRFGIEGFKKELVEPRQGADVYKHVLGQAGAIMIGDAYLDPRSNFTNEPYVYPPQPGANLAATGSQLAVFNLEWDKRQTKDPEHGQEAMVEVLDDYAGQDIGNMVLDAIRGNRSIQSVRQDIFRRLCDH